MKKIISKKVTNKSSKKEKLEINYLLEINYCKNLLKLLKDDFSGVKECIDEMKFVDSEAQEILRESRDDPFCSVSKNDIVKMEKDLKSSIEKLEIFLRDEERDYFVWDIKIRNHMGFLSLSSQLEFDTEEDKDVYEKYVNRIMNNFRNEVDAVTEETKLKSEKAGKDFIAVCEKVFNINKEKEN